MFHEPYYTILCLLRQKYSTLLPYMKHLCMYISKIFHIHLTLEFTQTSTSGTVFCTSIGLIFSALYLYEILYDLV